jgi:hypothetical protein
MSARWYEWVFSGVGVLAISVIVGFFRRQVIGWCLASPAHGTSVSANVLTPVTDSSLAIASTTGHKIALHHHQMASGRLLQGPKATEPYPDEIMEELDALSPYDKHRPTERYAGLRVLWLLALRSMKRYDDTWHVTFTSSSKGLLSTTVTADFAVLPPEIKVLPAHAEVWIRGQIRYIDIGWFINLEADPEIVEVIGLPKATR